MRKVLTSLSCAFLLSTSALAGVSPRAEAPMPTTPLYGSVSAGDSGYVTGIALINSSGADLEKFDTGSVTPVVPLGATYGDGSYYRIYRTTGRYATNKFEVANPVTWANTLAPSSFSGFSGTNPLGMAYDGETGNLFYATCASPWAIYTVTTKTAPPTATATKYCDLPEQWIALAMDNDNRTFYGLTLAGTLKKLDKVTKEVTVVGETGLVSVAGTSAAVDPATGELYFASWPSDKESGLYHINKTTAEATLVKSFTKHEHIQGMFFMPTIKPEIPGKPAMPSCSFEGIEMSGKISFYLPASDMKGTTLEGNLKWTVTAGGKVLATGEAAPGAQVSTPITVESAGLINFNIYCSNDAGDGPQIHCQALVGPEQPLAVTDLNLTIEGLKSSMTWTAPTKGVNGKDLEADKLTYDVYLLPERVKVGDALKECAYTGTLTEPAQLTVHNYEVVARHYDVEGLPATSAPFVLGAAQPPYYEDFENYVYIPQWTILDLNNDGHTWSTSFNHFAYISGISRTWDTEQHDDMIVSPSIDVKGGFAYDIEMEVVAYKAAEDKPHVISVLYGSAPTKEAMTNVILDKLNITSQETDNLANGIPQIIKARFIPEQDARVNLGVHVANDRGPDDFELHSFRVMAPKLLESPAPVADLKVLPDFDLKDECTLTFTTPTTSVENHPLIGLEKVEIVRNGEVVETIEAPEMGKEYTVVDSKAAHGENNYKVYAYNDGGASDPAEATAYTGLQLPGQVTGVSIYETATDGTIHVEWTAPETDIYGQPLNLKYIDYEVKGVDANIESYTLMTDIKDLKADIKIQEPGQMQKYKYVFVYAKNAAGSSPSAGTSNSIIVGEPLAMPYIEHFTTARYDNAWITNPVVGKSKWNTFPGKAQDVSDVNGDVIVLSFSGAVGDRGEMQSGKIAITGKKARLSFYAMNNGTASKNAIEAWVILEDGTTEMLTREIPAGSKKDWTFYTASLEKYEGQNIKLNFIGEMIAGQGILLDEVKVDNHYTNDLRVDKFDIVRSVTPGMEIPVTITYTNFGDDTATGYTMVLLIDDKEVYSAPGEAVKAGETATMSFKTALPETDAQVKHKGEIRIDYPEDQLTENNSKECLIINKVSANPAPTALAAKQEGNAVMLSWTAPKAPAEKPAAVTESFEEFDSWETEYMGYWTLFDEDELPTATMDLDGFPLAGEPKSWFIFNGSDRIFAANYRVHSGDKCISNMTSWDFIEGKNNSDWIISPALWGHEQKISFYARQCGPNYHEDFEVLYSTSDDAPASFKQLAKERTNTYEWTKFEYTLPEGTNYFAIRCVSLNQFMLQVDDITYIPDNGSSPNLELKSYDVWRDGEKVGSADAAAVNYIDPINDGNEHDYMLTAVYNRGLSVPSNSANVKTTSVNSLTEAGIAVTAVKGAILIDGECDNVTVYTTDGRLAGSGVCHGHLSIEVTPGIYIVNLAGHAPVKVSVK